jgi:hypothetical protein
MRNIWILFFNISAISFAQNVEWQTAPNDYEFSMSLTSVVLNQESEYFTEVIEIGVFDSNQICVGVGFTETYYEPMEANLGFVTVFGNSFQETYTIKVKIGNVIYNAGNLSFVANEILGSFISPFIISPFFVGCTNQLALNYNPEATIDDESCEFTIEGCIDVDAFNFDPEANTNDGSCIPKVLGCYSSNFIEYNENANDGNQEDYCLSAIIYGCINEYYVEYNSLANIDDGTCLYSWQELSNQLQSDLNAIVPEDGISQEDVEAAYLAGIASVNTQEYDEIAINLPLGWSFFGCFLNDETDLIDATYCITDKIIIIKDYLGAAYIPEFNFNGIGALTPGIGYQVKLNQSVTEFNFCN